jgi:hypothetical protein
MAGGIARIEGAFRIRVTFPILWTYLEPMLHTHATRGGHE